MAAKKSGAKKRSKRSGDSEEGSDELSVIIETPKGSRNKYNYDEKTGMFRLGGVLPAGAVFPFDFGFVPSTVGGDGDPLDVLVLMDEPVFTGCLVAVRLIGVIEAEQRERDGERTRNDRLVGVAAEAHNHRNVTSLDQLNQHLVDEIEHFFVSYNDIKGKRFEPLGRFGPERAHALVKEGAAKARARRGAKSSGAKSKGRSSVKKKNRR